ncbi:hypothetical protein E3N88_31500 [Mikania micrantha]|uniref:Ninja-family protein n=1 Tax=Mikania micrantha TaxID=192012 RepID=A0A5N6MQI1_9ASTR|nr:hypothetical protein E3N88_31500 [Mikania micrantha]
MGERTSNEMEQLSLRTKIRFPSDLLQRFTASPPTISDPEEALGCGSGEKVELNLGLSLGGRFGVDKSGSKLVRSSSIAAILPVARDDDALGSVHENLNPSPVPGRSYSDLVRTSSLPVETEEEWRKRKELQSLRRLAAKRRRSDKQRNLTGSEASAVGFRSNSAIDGGGNSKGGGGWLSSTPQFEKKHSQGRGSISGETRSVMTLQERCWNKATVAASSSSSSSENGKKKREGGGDDHQEEMPCVFTQGDGPNGRMVEGILYKYGRGEQVKIMCVCHGTFLTPAEFVKHAGGTDSLHPLKHIVVKPTSSFS